MLDEKTIEKMFEEWWFRNAPKNKRGDKFFIAMASTNIKYQESLVVFKAAIKLLLPIIQKQDEAISFYGDISSWDKCGGERIRIKDCDIYKMNGFPFGGKLARSTKQEVSEMIKRLGGEG